MVYLIKFLQVLILLSITFLWNTIVLKRVYFFIKQTNTKNTEAEFNSPTALKKDMLILKYVQYFYWLIAIVVSVLLTIA